MGDRCSACLLLELRKMHAQAAVSDDTAVAACITTAIAMGLQGAVALCGKHHSAVRVSQEALRGYPDDEGPPGAEEPR